MKTISESVARHGGFFTEVKDNPQMPFPEQKLAADAQINETICESAAPKYVNQQFFCDSSNGGIFTAVKDNPQMPFPEQKLAADAQMNENHLRICGS